MTVTSTIAHTYCFDSTLYTSPILDLLLANVPPDWQCILRLGLQEAFVNAVKHGNRLDSSRKVIINIYIDAETYHWVFKDQGAEGSPVINLQNPCSECECGRGVYIMQQIFDHVHWNPGDRQLHLHKQIHPIAC